MYLLVWTYVIYLKPEGCLLFYVLCFYYLYFSISVCLVILTINVKLNQLIFTSKAYIHWMVHFPEVRRITSLAKDGMEKGNPFH